MDRLLHTRRSAALLLAGLPLAFTFPAQAAAPAAITVHKDPNCGCCTGWVEHLKTSGFTARIIETSDLNSVKARLGVPKELAACHTAEVAGYVLEGHVPAEALTRLLAERPEAIGLAVPGMPFGSPGMGGTPQEYDVILFGAAARRTYMRFLGTKQV